MFKQLCQHHLSRQPIFTPKTYNQAVTLITLALMVTFLCVKSGIKKDKDTKGKSHRQKHRKTDGKTDQKTKKTKNRQKGRLKSRQKDIQAETNKKNW